MKNFPREQIIQEVLKNFDQDDVQAYFNGQHPKHDEAVKSVTKMVEDFFGSEEKASGLLELDERRARQEMFDDQRSVDQQVRDILQGHDERWSKPYFDSGHQMHGEAVRRMQILTEARYGDEPFEREIFPVVTQSGDQNAQQVGLKPSINFTTEE